MAKIRGGRVKSLTALKKSVKRSMSGGRITRVPKEAPLTARFLEEPDRWFEFYTHYDAAAKKGGVCTGDDCPFCADDIRVSKRLLANAVDQEESKVIALEMPTTLVSALLRLYDKYGTLLDRDIELSRDGEGLATEYSAIPESRSKFNHKAYEPLDLEEILEAEVEGDDSEEEDDDADDDFLPPKKTAKKGSRTSPGTSKRKRAEEYADDDEDDDPPPRRTLPRPAKKATKALSKPLAKKGLRRN